MNSTRFGALPFLSLLVCALCLLACIPPESADEPSSEKPTAGPGSVIPSTATPAPEKKTPVPSTEPTPTPAPEEKKDDTGPLSDLALHLVVPSSATAGEAIGDSTSLKVNNIGGATAPGKLAPGTVATGYGTDVYLAKTVTPPPEQGVLYTASYGSDWALSFDYVLLKGGAFNNTNDLVAGGTVDYSAQLPGLLATPADTPAGDYYICAWVDSGENVTEEDETNNFHCEPITIGALAAVGDFDIKLASSCAVVSPAYDGYNQAVVVLLERSGGHNSAVNFALGGSTTSSVTGTFGPSNLVGSSDGTTVLTLAVDSALAAGDYTASVIATDGVSTHTRHIGLTLLGTSAGAGLSFTKSTIGAGGSDQYGHTLAVTAASSWSAAITGQVLSWGSNGFGELGNNNFGNDSDVPVTVLGPDGSTPLEGIVSVASGRTHGLALRGDGTVWAWGYASHGQLGGDQGMGAGFTGVDPDGNPIGYVPFAVPTCGPPDVISIAAGDAHSLALDASGDMWSWGHNQWGALGDGTTDHRWTPGPVLDPSGSNFGDVAVIGAGHFHSLAAKANGDLFAWGKNEYGALGNMNQPFDESFPVAVLAAGGLQLTEIVDVDGGYQHSIALDSEGQVYVWGDNYWGQLGDDTMDKTLPHDQQTQDFATLLTAPVISDTLTGPVGPLGTYPATDVDAGADHSLVVSETGSTTYPRCHAVVGFGWGTLGQNGDGLASERDYAPVAVSTSVLGKGHVSAVSAMGSHSIALIDWQPYEQCGDGTDGVGNVFTWGDNRVGQLGDGAGSGLPPCTLGTGTAACETSPVMVTAATSQIMLPNP